MGGGSRHLFNVPRKLKKNKTSIVRSHGGEAGLGDGPQLQHFKNLISDDKLKDRVTMLSLINDPANFINSINILVSNLRSEGMPCAVLESLCLNKKLLLSDIPGHRQFAKYATLYLKDDKTSFRDSLKSLENGTSDIKPYDWNLSKMCHQLAREIYDPPTT